MSRFDEADSRLRGEDRRTAIDDLREELKKSPRELMETAERYLKKNVIEPRFRDMVKASVESYLETGSVSPNRLHAVAGVVACIDIEEDE